MVLISARFWKLLLASYITQARLTNRLESWILRHPWVTSSRRLWQGIGLVSGLLVLVEVGLGMASPDCARSGSVFIYTAGLMMAFWVVIAALTWRLRRLQDGFFVVRELKMLGVVILLSNLILLPLINLQGNRPPPIPIIVSSIVQLIIQTWYPLWKSYHMAFGTVAATNGVGDSRPRSMASAKSPAVSTSTSATKMSGIWSAPLSADSNLDEILRHPVGFEAMKRFLTLEFSVENVLCWQLLHEYRRERRPSQVQAHFNAVYEGFVRADAPNEVNISSTLKQHFYNVIHGKPINLEQIMKMKAPKVEPGAGAPDAGTDIKLRLLKQLYRDILRVIQMDSFQRFRQTTEFEDLVRCNSNNIRIVMAKF